MYAVPVFFREMDEILKLFYKALTVLNTGNERQEAKEHFLSLEQELQLFQPCPKTKADFDNVRLGVYRCLGELLFETNEYGESVDYFVKAVQINKTDLTLWFSTAKAGLKEGNIELSLVAFKEVLKLNPKHLLALTDAIPIAIAVEDFYHGQIWTKELLGLRPKSLVANQALKWFRETTHPFLTDVGLSEFSIPDKVPMQDFLDSIETLRSKIVVRSTAGYVRPKNPTVLLVKTDGEMPLFDFLKDLVTQFDSNVQSRVHVNPVHLEIKAQSGPIQNPVEARSETPCDVNVHLDWRARELLGIPNNSADDNSSNVLFKNYNLTPKLSQKYRTL